LYATELLGKRTASCVALGVNGAKVNDAKTVWRLKDLGISVGVPAHQDHASIAEDCITENHPTVGNEYGYAGLYRNAAGGQLLLDTIHPLRSFASDEEACTSGTDNDRTIVGHRVRASRCVGNVEVERVTANCRPQLSTGQDLWDTIAPHCCGANTGAPDAYIAGD
jgi:hypothetical protein